MNILTKKKKANTYKIDEMPCFNRKLVICQLEFMCMWINCLPKVKFVYYNRHDGFGTILTPTKFLNAISSSGTSFL